MNEIELNTQVSDTLPPLAQSAQPLPYFQGPMDSWRVVVRAIGVMAAVCGGLQVANLLLNLQDVFSTSGILGIALLFARLVYGTASALLLIAGIRLLIAIPSGRKLLIAGVWVFMISDIILYGLHVAWIIQQYSATTYSTPSSSISMRVITNSTLSLLPTLLTPAFVLYLITRQQAKRLFCT